MTIPKRVTDYLGVRPGDRIAYVMKGDVVTLKRLDPFDAAFHAAHSRGMEEWLSEEDEKAFRDL